MTEPDTPLRTLAWEHLRGGAEAGVYVQRLDNHQANPPHDHVFHELVFVEQGSADHVAVDGVRKLRPGDVILLRPQVWHGYSEVRSLCIVNCLIDNVLMRRLTRMLGFFDHAFELFQKRSPRPRRSPPVVLHAKPAERVILRQRLDEMVIEQHQRKAGWQSAVTAGLLDVLVRVLRLHGDVVAGGQQGVGDQPRSQSSVEQAVLDTVSFLEANYQRSYALTELARRVHVSAPYLSRCFSRHMGMGVVAYLHRVRAEEACRLLRYTDAPITQIAGQVGYGEVAYFSRRFRTQIGCAPREYRQQAML